MEKCKEARKEIYVAARSFSNRDPLTRQRKPTIICEPLDLASFESIRAFSKKMEKEERLDILIDNAGTMRDPIRILTKVIVILQTHSLNLLYCCEAVFSQIT